MPDEQQPVITILSGALGWSFNCRYCDIFSGWRPTEARAKKEAAMHVRGKGHLVLVAKVAAMKEKENAG